MTSPEYFISHVVGHTPTANEVVDTWPLHITVVPPFTLSTGSDERDISKMIQEVSSRIGVIRGDIALAAGSNTLYGAANDTSVTKINDPSGKLRKLHVHLIDNLLLSAEFINLNPEWTGEQYSPHITTEKCVLLEQPFICDRLTIHRTRRSMGEKILLETVALISLSEQG